MTNITVIGNATEQLLVKDALAMSSVDIDAKLKNPYRIEFHTAAEFMAAGLYVTGTKKPAWGYVVGKRTLWINGTRAARRPYSGQYVTIHELGHAIDSDWNTAAKHVELITLMPTVKPGTSWKGGTYLNRPREIYADAFAEAVGIGSPLDDDYGDIPDADLPRLLVITFKPIGVTPPVVDPSPPEPLPLPDPDVALLRAKVAVLESRVDAAMKALEGE